MTNWAISFVFSIFCPALGLIILAGLLIFWVLNKKLPQEKSLRIIFWGFMAIIIIHSLILTFLNYWLWGKQLITQQLLPPSAPIFYVLGYSWHYYWFEPIITIIFSLVVFWGIDLFNKKFEENLFYNEERYLAGLGILATGWPNCLIYLCLVLFLGVVSHLLISFISFLKRKIGLERMIQGRDLNVKFKKGEVLEAPPLQVSASPIFRLSLLYFWLPCALLVLLLSGIISKYIPVMIQLMV